MKLNFSQITLSLCLFIFIFCSSCQTSPGNAARAHRSPTRTDAALQREKKALQDQREAMLKARKELAEEKKAIAEKQKALRKQQKALAEEKLKAEKKEAEAKKAAEEKKELERKKAEDQKNAKKPLPFNKIRPRSAELLDDTPLQTKELEKAARPQMRRDFRLPVRNGSRKTEDSFTSEYPDNLIKGMTNPNEKLEDLTLVFDAATVDEVVAAFAAELHFNYLVDPSVKGAVTMTLKSNELTAREVWSTFEHLLWLAGAYASKNPGFIHILPFDKMPKERRLFATHEIQPNVIVEFINIRYKKSSEVINVIKPFITDGASTIDLPDSNTILIVETPANFHKLQEIIKRIDIKGEREWPVQCFSCHQVDADTIVEELQQLLPVLGLPVATGTGASGGAIKLTAIQRLGTIIVSAALPEVISEIGSWITAFDRSDLLDKEEIYFYNVKHTTVDKLSSALDAFFNTVTSESPSSTSTSSTKGTSSKTSATSGKQNKSKSSDNSRTSSSSRRNTGNRRQNSNDEDKLNKTVFDTEVIVYTDEESNRLTIKTTPRTWNLIRIFLQRQDVPPRQVSIQAIITDIDISENNEFGISYNLAKHGLAINPSIAGRIDTNNLIAMGTDAAVKGLTNSTNPGLSLMISQNGDPLAAIKAVAGDGNTSVLSEPHVIVRSGAQAYLQAGSKVSIPTESTSYTSSSGNMSTNYEYVDTGVIMTVTPYITAGNEVRLEIEQEFSVPVASALNKSTYDINTKKVTSELIVADNTTIMMGGMIQTTDTKTFTGVPLLMDIPYLGALFRSNAITQKRSELLILLTVNVIDNRNPQEELVRKYKKSLEQIDKKHNTSLY